MLVRSVLGLPDAFIEHMTTREEQLASVGLDEAGIAQTVRNLLQASRV